MLHAHGPELISDYGRRMHRATSLLIEGFIHMLSGPRYSQAGKSLTENRTTELDWRLSMKIRFSSDLNPVSRRQFLLTGDKGF